MEAVIFIGIQASGKSTFFKERFFTTHLRLNYDMLKTRHRERILLEACLESKQKFVVDNTNPTVLERAKYIEPAKNKRFQVIGYYFQTNIEDALMRNALRIGNAQIPEKGVRATLKRLQTPNLSEGFDQLFRVGINDKGQFIVEEWTNEV
jgi:predicted kinase